MKLFVRFLQVTKRDVDAPESEWRNWSWTSDGDLMLNGAFFRASGPEADFKVPISAMSASFVAAMTASAGALSCNKGSLC
jgi:pectate lyase